MLQLKSFSLKLLYFAVGVMPLLIMAFMAKQQFEFDNNLNGFFWIFPFSGAVVLAVLVQRKLRKMGVLNMKEIGTYVALFVAVSICMLLFRSMQ